MALVSSRCGYRPSGAFGAIGLILGSSADNLIATLAVFELGTIVLCAVAHLCSRNGL